MDSYAVNDEKQPKHSRLLVYAILGGALVIAIGLALGLSFGLRTSTRGLEVVDISTTTTPAPVPVDEAPKSKTGTYRFASVAATSKECSEIGTVTLAKGGSAVDAAITTSLCEAVINPSGSGLGGGFFMTIYNRSSGRADVLDARERAPLAANESLYVGREKGASVHGGLAIAVPGELKGYWEAHQKYGKLPWKDLFEPTIRLCKEGVKITPLLERVIQSSVSLLRKFSFLMYFKTDTNTTLKTRDTVKYPRMANTLEVIASEGADAFYNGSLTDTIVQEIQENGGIITREDLTGYKATWRTPVTFTMRDRYTVYSMPPPGSGAVLEYMLNILDGYNFSKDSVSTDAKSILTYHRIVESMKFAYAKRTQLGDEDFEDVADLVKNMTSREFGDSTRERINDTNTQDTQYYNPSYYSKPDQGTSHVSIVDVHGNAVGITSTINYLFGSLILGNTTGIVYNNEMDDFSTPGLVNVYGVSPSPINFIKPGKRPQSSMCPAVIVDGFKNVALVLGGSGGTRITTGALLVALHALKFGRSAGEALDQKRLHHQLIPDALRVEGDFPKAVVDGLRAKGHNISSDFAIYSDINIVAVSNNMKYGASDYRRDGVPDGY